MLSKINSLDKIAHRKVELLKLLANQNKPCSTTTLSQQLSVSSKTLLSYLKELQHYLEAFKQDIQLVKNNDGYYLSKKNSFSIEAVYHEIIKDTLFYYFFLYTFHQQNETIDSYAKVNFFSYSYIYRQIRLMNQLLKPLCLSFDLSPLKMNRSELRIRYLFFYYYFYTCNGVEWPFQVVTSAELDDDIQAIEALTSIKLSFIQKEQLKYWFALCQTRYRLNEFIDPKVTFYQTIAQNSPFYISLLPFIKNFSKNNSLSEQKNEEYFIFFVIHQILNLPIESFLHLTEDPLIKKTAHLLEDTVKLFPKAKLSTFFKNELFYLVYLSSHLGDSYLELLENTYQQSPISNSYQTELATLLDENKIDSDKMPFFKKNITHLIHRHLIANYYQPMIRLLVVTKLDESKKQALYDKIYTLPFYLIITDQETDCIDLILSDYYLQPTREPIFYWHMFPLKVEWDQLEARIRTIEQLKFSTQAPHVISV